MERNVIIFFVLAEKSITECLLSYAKLVGWFGQDFLVESNKVILDKSSLFLSLLTAWHTHKERAIVNYETRINDINEFDKLLVSHIVYV